METEIIKTDDPNIVIERTVVDTMIDLNFLEEERDGILLRIDEYSAKISALEEAEIPELLKNLVQKEIEFLYHTRDLELLVLGEINKKLNNGVVVQL